MSSKEPVCKPRLLSAVPSQAGRCSLHVSRPVTFPAWQQHNLWCRLAATLSLSLSISLSLRFNGYFPGEPGLAGVYWSKGWWRWWWQLDYWSYKSTLRPSHLSWAVSPPVGCYRLQPPSSFIIITQPESWYSFTVSRMIEGWVDLGTGGKGAHSPCCKSRWFFAMNTTARSAIRSQDLAHCSQACYPATARPLRHGWVDFA